MWANKQKEGTNFEKKVKDLIWRITETEIESLCALCIVTVIFFLNIHFLITSTS